MEEARAFLNKMSENPNFVVKKFNQKDFDTILTSLADEKILMKELVNIFVHVYGKFWKPQYADKPIQMTWF